MKREYFILFHKIIFQYFLKLSENISKNISWVYIRNYDRYFLGIYVKYFIYNVRVHLLYYIWSIHIIVTVRAVVGSCWTVYNLSEIKHDVNLDNPDVNLDNPCVNLVNPLCQSWQSLMSILSIPYVNLVNTVLIWMEDRSWIYPDY